MAKRVYFYMVKLMEKAHDTECDYRIIRDLVTTIINKHASKRNNMYSIDLTTSEDLHITADIFDYSDAKMFFRLGNQKPSGSFLYRNYETNETESLLKSNDEQKAGIEIYTFGSLDYETGIFAIVSQQGAPTYRYVRNLFIKYTSNYYLDFIPVPNPNGIDLIYKEDESRISNIEVEVPVPTAEALQNLFGWSDKEILDIQGKNLKAVMKLSSIDRKTITENGEESRGLIDCIKSKLTNYTKARIHAKAAGKKAQDYNFFNENFSYPIEISSYKATGGVKHFFTAEENIIIYRDNLNMAFNENYILLKQISNR